MRTSNTLEGQTQAELHQSRLIGLASDLIVAARRHSGSRVVKLRVIEEVKEFSPELQIREFLDLCDLLRSEIKIVNALSTEPRINTRLISKSKGARIGEAGLIEPRRGIPRVLRQKPLVSGAGNARQLIASGDVIRAKRAASK